MDTPSFARDVLRPPNLISLSRIALMWVAAVLYFYVSPGAGIVLAVVAGVTDYVDGAVARARGQVTRLGEVLDLFGDLCFESLALLVAVSQGFFPPLVLFAYLFREFWVMAIRRCLAAAGLGIPSSVWGKLKTNFLMWGLLPTFLAIAGILPSIEALLRALGKTAVGVGLVASYVSAWDYTRTFIVGYGRVPGVDKPA